MSGEQEGVEKRLFHTYRELLNLGSSAVSLESLTGIIQAHLMRLPFENISKLLYYRNEGALGIPSLERYLEGAKRYAFGGTCYANNYYLSRLLGHLGFKVRLCGASMSRPDVHAVIIVTLEGRDWLVDVGYGAPLLEPLPLEERSDVVVRFDDVEYVLHPRTDDGRSRLEMRRDGQAVHGYTINPAGREIEHFEPAIRDSYRDDATFMNSILLARYSVGRSTVIHNLSVTRYDGEQKRVSMAENVGQLAELIEREFGIPSRLADHALRGISFSGDAWS